MGLNALVTGPDLAAMFKEVGELATIGANTAYIVSDEDYRQGLAELGPVGDSDLYFLVKVSDKDFFTRDTTFIYQVTNYTVLEVMTELEGIVRIRAGLI